MSNKPTSITTTFHRSYNYGATLQTYALQTVLLGIGFENQVLDFYRNPYEKAPLLSGDIKLGVARFVIRLLYLLHSKEHSRMIGAFDKFTKEKICLTEQYTSMQQLMQNPPDADCYFTGSDQIFSLRDDSFTVERNLLRFIDNKKKYSYAASLSNYDLTQKEKKEFSDSLKSFSIISLRERKAIDYMKGFINGQLRYDIDPVLLLTKDEWSTLAKAPMMNDDYILYFQVNGNENANEVLEKVKSIYNCPIVCIQSNPLVRVKADKVVLDSSPEEFLGWFMNARCIVTTSFHGTAFSILFNKVFYSLTKDNSNPIRILELLERVDLTDRLITSSDSINNESFIEWSVVDEKIKTYRNDSIRYLEEIYANFV